MDVEAAFARAVGLHREGRVGEAEDACRSILAEAPEHARALHLLGVLRFASGRADEAIGLLERAGGAESFIRGVVQREPLLATRPDKWERGRSPYAVPELLERRMADDLPPAVRKHALTRNPADALGKVEALALEMALHDERERRAMEGELAALEDEWREAELLARIADALPGEPPEDSAGIGVSLA